MPVGLGLAAAGTVAGSAISASGAKSAAKTEANAANQAATIQQDMFGQTRSDLAPFRDIGTAASPAYLKLLGINPGGSTLTGVPAAANPGDPDYAAYVDANPDVAAAFQQDGHYYGGDKAAYGKAHYTSSGQTEGRALPTVAATPAQTGFGATGAPTEIQSYLESLPGYQFTKQQGILEANRSLGSRGLTGAQAKGISRFVTGLADKTYGDTVSRLGGAVTTGANAALGTGQISQGVANSIGGNIVGAGQASAAGTVGAANAISSGLSSISQLPLASKYMGIYGKAA